MLVSSVCFSVGREQVGGAGKALAAVSLSYLRYQEG